MNKLYQKNELFFAILWIVVYVIAMFFVGLLEESRIMYKSYYQRYQ